MTSQSSNPPSGRQPSLEGDAAEDKPGPFGDAGPSISKISVQNGGNSDDGRGQALEDTKSSDPETCPKCNGQKRSHDPNCGSRYRACWAPWKISKVANDGEKKG